MSESEKVRWCFSDDGAEQYYGDEETREGAIREAIAMFDLGEGQEINVGKIRPITAGIDTDNVLEQVMCQIEDEAGEAADGIELSRVSSKDPRYAELDKELNAVFTAWMERHGITPRVYGVEDAETIIITKEILGEQPGEQVPTA